MDSFRKDINGLRAWAVVAVVLFHFGVPGFDGGFIGVDVFFVISGFLMTGIILDKLATPPLSSATGNVKSFSIIGFYLARARRILPALMALCVALLMLGWFFLPALDYRMLATHVITALVFISNIKFWREAGYFDAASHEKLLLHTWSLSVEWQFYLLFPVALVILWKLWPNRRFIGIMLLAGFVTSLAISVVMTRLTPAAAFYLLPTRAWEMLAGGLVYFYASQFRPSQGWAKLLEALGFGLILASIFLFDGTTPWPGWQALIPVLGTVLVLLAARSDSWLSGTAIAQWLGKTSYSIYLWHWPFSVALIYFGVQGEVLPVLVGLLLTLLFGWASWAYIEQPARRGLMQFSKIPQIAVTGLLVFIIAAPALAIRAQDGVAGRLDPRIDAIFAEVENKNPRIDECHSSGAKPVPGCTYGGDKLGAIVMGDSHALSMVTSVAAALPSKDLHVLEWSRSSCRTIKGLIQERRHGGLCGQHVAESIVRSSELEPNAPLLIVDRISSGLHGPNESTPTVAPTEYLSGPFEQRTDEFFAEMQDGMVETACAFAEHRP
ncbi:MAG: acyltransferase, partial [Marinospirillum sp.]|uniref:acyltransferase family protein n=1 Tax=Marinospirillum sp. TaxID=2183934 RepID=UPI001A0C2DF2